MQASLHALSVVDRALPHVRTLYEGPVISLLEWRCPGHDPSVAADECGDAYEVVVVRRGVFARQMAGERAIIDAGAAAFWHPGDVYRILHPVPGGDCCSIVRLPVAGVRDLLATVDPGAAEADTPRFPVPHVPLAGRPYLLHRLAMAAAHAKPGDVNAGGIAHLGIEERAIAFALVTIAAAHRHCAERRTPVRAGPASNRHAREYTARVREFIAARYRQPLTLQNIARAVGCSPYHLSRLVSTTAGLPIYRLVIRLRLRDALERVLDTRDDISAIAFDVGFASHSHFAEAFRREFGLTPSAVRKRDTRPACPRPEARRTQGTRRGAGFR